MQYRRSRPFAWWIVTLALILNLFLPINSVFGQTESPPTPSVEKVDELLSNLTPEERVGQLFIVTFQGSSIGPDLPIYDLIHQHHIGGVVLLSQNDNIVPQDGDPSTIPQQVQSLINQLQKAEYDSSLHSQTNSVSGLTYLPNYIPLFVAISQEGDGFSYDQILSGLSEIPSQMAIGATWNPNLAVQVGSVVGKELRAMGFNLLFGPSLDVLDPPQLELTRNLGTRTFGGDPYWVAEMGQAYIRGVHTGSDWGMAVVAKHFPGYGSSDRLPEEEVSTVRKSLDELKSIDLAPFLTTSGNALSPESTTDALLSSHIRYQGLQGTIRTTTRPVSLDPQALSLLMSLPGLVNWRENGGVLISDDLGNQAIRRFYDLTNQSFDPRRVTLNAFLAGNDVLYMADYTTSASTDSYAEILKTLDFFAQKYREDAAFAQRVDKSVQRILKLKMRLYPTFSFDMVLNDPIQLDELGKNQMVASEVARSAATLLSPSQSELDTTIPDPPNQNDRIVFIVDHREARQCTTCNPAAILDKQSMQNAVIKLYGPQAGGLVSPNNLVSYSIGDLNTLNESRSDAPDLERDLQRAHWIVIVVSGENGSTSSFDVLKRFLAERPDLFQQKRLIVFSLTAPYYLDATNISKLTAYYTLYSKISPFIDTAAYLLFGELRATGAAPVSVPGIDYWINDVLFPDPSLVIPLDIDLPESNPTTTSTVTPVVELPIFNIGDVIPLRAGEIKDYNGRPVPDGTPVDFVFTYSGEPTSVRQIAFTQQGIARTTFAIPASGFLEIIAESETARSDTIKLDIPGQFNEELTPLPTIEPSETPTAILPTAAPDSTCDYPHS